VNINFKTLTMKRKFYLSLLFICLIGINNSCQNEIIKAFESIGKLKMVQKRIDGQTFLDFAKKDKNDFYVGQNGYLCVTHNPGCGWWGNSGKDIFFGPNTPLSLLCKIDRVEFTYYWPCDIPSMTSRGTLAGTNSYGAEVTPNGAVPCTVDWRNTCWSVFGGRNLFYVISFIITMPEGLDIGVPVYDVNSPFPSCAPAGYCNMTNTPPQTDSLLASGFDGSVRYCNPTNSVANGSLHIEGKLVTPLPKAQGASIMNEDIPVSFSPSGGGVPSSSGFKTKYIYKQGTWQFTKIQITGLTGQLPGSLSFNLPGIGPGTPIFDFTTNNKCNR